MPAMTPHPTQRRLPARPQTAYGIEIFDSFAAAEPTWQSLERNGILTPYQGFDWLRLLHEAGADSDGRLAICVIHQDGAVRGLLPLLVTQQAGIRYARLLGAEQANCGWMILAPGFSPDAAALQSIFTRIKRQLGGLDLLKIENLPANWAGTDNPLLRLPTVAGASRFYIADISGAERPYLETRVPAKKRGNLRRGRRRMEEGMGPVRLVRADDEAMLARIHAAFLEQRQARFAEMGIDNVFATPLFRRFFLSAAKAGFGQARPVLVAHALMAGDDIVATTWGTVCASHYSLYINSTSSGAASRYSLMGILIADLMDELLAAGMTGFDLGLGDFDYKTDWTEPQTVYEALIPLTWQGAIFAQLSRARLAIKRTVKQTPILWSAAQAARRLLFRLGRGQEASGG